MASQLPGWLRWYKKPSYVDFKTFAGSLNQKFEESAKTSSPRASISSIRSETSVPKDLSLERILSNKTCSPMSLYDFYMYLKHIEFSQENLEFYIWFRDYQKRHEERYSNPTSKEAAVRVEERSFPKEQQANSPTKHAVVITEQETCTLIDSNISPEFVAYIESLILHQAARYPKPCCTNFPSTTAVGTTTLLPDDAHRNELEQVIALFLTPGGKKELNIPPSMRKTAITNLTVSSSPEHFAKIANHIYALLKDCSHRNFVRLGVNNGTFETLCMVTFIGITFSLLGFLIMLLLAFACPRIHESSRWRGLAVIPLWFVGISFLLAGLRGSCFLLLLFSRRQELPWERVEDHASSSVKSRFSYISGGGGAGGRTNSIRRNLLRHVKKLMVFEKKIRVRDMGLRSLQRKIVVQSVVGAVLGTAILEVFFLCLPIWKGDR